MERGCFAENMLTQLTYRLLTTEIQVLFKKRNARSLRRIIELDIRKGRSVKIQQTVRR